MTPEPVWVDLGLPSGLLWLNCNLGASKPESVGLYFSWGNTDGHNAGGGYDFSIEVYEQTPGASISSNLTPEHDAANVLLGDGARMPSSLEFRELADNCTSIWTMQGGVLGLLLTSNINGKSIFLPAAGLINGTSLVNRDTQGVYWSSTFDEDTRAKVFEFDSSSVGPQDNRGRRFGFTIRPVRPV